MRAVAVAASFALLGGCSSESGGSAVPLYDGGADAAHEAAPEAPADTIAEPPPESSAEAGFDAGPWPEAAIDAGESHVRLLTLNLHCLKIDGTAFPDNAARFAAIAQAAASEEVSVLTVQEACVRGTQDATASLRTALESATGQPWSAVWEPSHTAWEGTPDEAQEGQGILARGALSDERVLEYHHQPGLRRIAVGARLDAELGGAFVWSLHLEVGDAAGRLAQARETASVAVAAADPSLDIILAGDCNDVTGSAPLQAIESFGFSELSSPLPAAMIDHVFAHRGAGLGKPQARKVFDGTEHPVVSDHPGVLVQWEPAQGPSVTRTRLVAHTAASGWLALRGGTAPLDWGWGWPAWQRADQSWLVVLTELQAGAPFEYKWLASDQTWQGGPNLSGTGGAESESQPGF